VTGAGEEKARIHILVRGRVQGVFFRASTCEEARARGLTGWVKNLPDGRVEIVAEGDRPALEALIRWCRIGPPYARVTGVDLTEEEYRGEFHGFEARY